MSYPEKAISTSKPFEPLLKRCCLPSRTDSRSLQTCDEFAAQSKRDSQREALEAEGRELLVLDNERKNAFEAAHAMHRSLFEFAFHDGVRPRRSVAFSRRNKHLQESFSDSCTVRLMRLVFHCSCVSSRKRFHSLSETEIRTCPILTTHTQRPTQPFARFSR